jgi:predicted nucleotidyltransferase
MENSAAEVALDHVACTIPRATTVVMGGSASTGRRTPTSDIDLLVFAPADSFENGRSVARVAHHRGERIDIFGYTHDSFLEWAERDFASFRPVLPFLLVEGIALREDEDTTRLREWAAQRLARGPFPTEHQLGLRRYAITDLADDLLDAGDPLLAALVRADLVRELAQFLLLANSQWLGNGKWLGRRLRAWDPEVADVIAEVAASQDHPRCARVALQLLEPYGGRLDEDFVR